MTARPDLEHELRVATRLAREAGRLVLQIQREGYDVADKSGGEPVTRADLAASELITSGLSEAFANDVVLSEEQLEQAAGARVDQRWWVVDPLDGTREFIDGVDDFVVMVGLCVEARPVLGVVHHPPSDTIFRAVRGDDGLECLVGDADVGERVHMREGAELANLRLVVSRSHRNPWVAEAKSRLGITQEGRHGSVGRKISLIASGAFDLYLHPGRGLKIWDTCAPEVLMSAAGGRVGAIDGSPLTYDPRQVHHHGGLLAAHRSVFERVAAKLADSPP